MMLREFVIWIWLVAGLLVDVVLMSYILFGGQIKFSIKLKGPLQFLSKCKEDDE